VSDAREAGWSGQSSAEGLYAEAVKKVEDWSRVRDPERIPVSSRSVPAQRERPMSDLCFSNVVFLAFIAMVINCTASMERKSQKIYAVVAAAEKYKGM
jgi:hypothetical protein